MQSRITAVAVIRLVETPLVLNFRSKMITDPAANTVAAVLCGPSHRSQLAAGY